MQNEEIVVDLAASEEDTTGSEISSGTTVVAEPIADLTPEEQEAADQDAEEKRKTGVQKRFDELTRKQKDAERRATNAERLLAERLGAETKAAVVEAPKETPKPKSDDFETEEEYIEALTDWKLDERDKKSAATRTQTAAQTEQQKQVETFQGRTTDFRAATPDFDTVVSEADHPVSQALVHEVLGHEQGPALQYFLAKNPDEVERLNKLGPLALAREIGRLEPRFMKAAAAGEVAAKVTGAPAPIIPITRTSSTAVKDPGEMSPAEYRKWREKN